MKKKLIAIIGTLMLLAMLVPGAVMANPGMVDRDLPASVAPGANFNVTMNLGAQFGQVVETLPAGFTYVSCAAGTNMPAGGVSGTVAGQVVTFTFYATATPATFTYTVKAPSTAGSYTFSGVFKSGPTTSETVGGDTSITVGGGELEAPTVVTNAASNIGTTTARINGNLTDMGTAASVNCYFQFGTTIAYGSQCSMVALTAPGSFYCSLSGLEPDTLYHFRAVAVGDGTSYGADRTFRTAEEEEEPGEGFGFAWELYETFIEGLLD